MSEQKPPALHKGHLLVEQPLVFTALQTGSLTGKGISTVEQFLAIYNTDTGPQGLGKLLQMQADELRNLARQAAAIVASEELERLETAPPTRLMGLEIEPEAPENTEVLDQPADEELPEPSSKEGE